MDSIALLVTAFRLSHEALREDMESIEPEVLFWQPGPGQNHCGFLYWHVVRDEDELMGRLSDSPQLWDSWAHGVGLEERGQGTGFDPAKLEGFRYEPVAFREYAEAVWARTTDVVGALEPGMLERSFPRLSEWTLMQLLLEGSIGHNWVHLGEARAIRGLRGWRFRE